MAIIGISITKETAFRDSVQPFSNMYFYNNGLGGAPDSAAASNLIDELVTFEKARHATSVEFTFGRCWLQALTEIGTNMIHQKALTGLGSASSNSSVDKERAWLFRRRAGQDSRGQPVYLRKWYHTMASWGGTPDPIPAGLLNNTAGLSDSQRSAAAAVMDAINVLSSGGGGWEICAKSGRAPTQPGWSCHRYLEHHQLGDQWRGQ